MDDNFVLAVDLGLVVFFADADVPVELLDHILSLAEELLYPFLSCSWVLSFCGGDLGELAFADTVDHFIEVGLFCWFFKDLLFHVW